MLDAREALVNQAQLRVAKRLAEKHLHTDDDVREVYLIVDQDPQGNSQSAIKLLEIVEGTPEVGIQPIGFAATAERGDLPVVIVELSPREFREFGGPAMEFGERRWRVADRLASREEAA